MSNLKYRDSERSKKFFTEAGSPLKEQFHGEIQADGSIKLISDGFVNFQEYIDSFEEETDIMNQINRINLGETDLMSVKKGDFIDTINMPKDYREVLQVVIDGRNAFYDLDVSIREKFGNSFENWFATMETPEWFEKMEIVKPVVEQQITEKESAVNES